MLNHLATLWLIFEKLAIAFSFVVNMILVIALMVVAVTFLLWGPSPNKLQFLLPDVARGLNKLGTTTIRTEVRINETLPVELDVPVQFDLPIRESINVRLAEAVPLRLPADITFPGGGGSLHATVSLRLPAGTVLPVELRDATDISRVMSVPVSETISIRETVPVVMSVPAEIPLGETDLNRQVVRYFNTLLGPYLSWWTTVLPASIEGTAVEDISDWR